MLENFASKQNYCRLAKANSADEYAKKAEFLIFKLFLTLFFSKTKEFL